MAISPVSIAACRKQRPGLANHTAHCGSPIFGYSGLFAVGETDGIYPHQVTREFLRKVDIGVELPGGRPEA